MSFAFLPAELRIRIVQYALQPQHNGFPSSMLHNNAIDSQQAAALALVSRSRNAIVTRHLHSQIRVTHSSSLHQLQSAFAKRPDLAALVRSIHLGPDAELPQLGWPIIMGSQPCDELVELFLMPSLSRPRDDEVLPVWLQVGYQCRLNSAIKTCQGFAIFKAIEAAMRDIDVEPWRQGYGRSEEKVGSRAWMTRLYLLQAALDLYLMEMRRIEDGRAVEQAEVRPAKRIAGPKEKSQPCRSSKCGHYPDLKVLAATTAAAASVQPKADGNCLRLTTAQLWQHLERKGGPADHFDSLVLLTRSSRMALDLGKREWRRVFGLLGGPHSYWVSDEKWQRIIGRVDEEEDYMMPKRPDHEPEDEDNSEDEEEDDDGGTFPGSDSSKSDLGSATSIQDGQEGAALDGPAYKVESLITMARGILTRTTQVGNLSIGSYLYRALPALPHPHLLRSVNIGPFPSWWTETIPAGTVGLMTGMAKLRMVGKVSEEDAIRLCVAPQSLKELEWVWPDYYANAPDVVENALNLQGHASDAEIAAARSHNTPRRRTLILVSRRTGEERLRRWTLSSSVQEAWRRGEYVPGTSSTVKVCPFEGPEPLAAETGIVARERAEAAAFTAHVYAEGRKWWNFGHTGGVM